MMSYGIRKRGYDRGGCVRGGLTSLCLRHIKSSPSQTLHRHLVQTTDDVRCFVLDAHHRPLWLCFSQFATHTVDNTVDLYAAKPDIRPESRFLPTPPACDAPVRGVPIGISPPRLVWILNRQRSYLSRQVFFSSLIKAFTNRVGC